MNAITQYLAAGAAIAVLNVAGVAQATTPDRTPAQARVLVNRFLDFTADVNTAYVKVVKVERFYTKMRYTIYFRAYDPRRNFVLCETGSLPMQITVKLYGEPQMRSYNLVPSNLNCTPTR